MTQSKHETLCQWVNENLEGYLDRDMTPSDRAMAESHFRQCAACAAELKLAQRVTSSLRDLPVLDCPARVTDAVYGQIEATPKRRNSARRDWRRLLSPVIWRPALAGVVTVLLVAMIAIVGGRKQVSPAYSARDLARARVEAKWALTFVNQVTQRTGMKMKDELLDPRVIRPVMRAVEKTTRDRGIKRDSQEVRNAG
jgi:anti-sigma factor RsiW